MSKQYFSIYQAIEKYGIKNVRFMLKATPVDFKFFAMAGIPLTLQSSNDQQVWAEYKIKEFDPHHKIRMVPSEKYEIAITVNGEETGKTNAFPNESYYVSDLNQIIHTGLVRVYAETEDGLQLVYGVYKDIYNDKEMKVFKWLSNFFNFNCFKTFA